MEDQQHCVVREFSCFDVFTGVELGIFLPLSCLKGLLDRKLGLQHRLQRTCVHGAVQCTVQGTTAHVKVNSYLPFDRCT